MPLDITEITARKAATTKDADKAATIAAATNIVRLADTTIDPTRWQSAIERTLGLVAAYGMALSTVTFQRDAEPHSSELCERVACRLRTVVADGLRRSPDAGDGALAYRFLTELSEGTDFVNVMAALPRRTALDLTPDEDPRSLWSLAPQLWKGLAVHLPSLCNRAIVDAELTGKRQGEMLTEHTSAMGTTLERYGLNWHCHEAVYAVGVACAASIAQRLVSTVSGNVKAALRSFDPTRAAFIDSTLGDCIRSVLDTPIVSDTPGLGTCRQTLVRLLALEQELGKLEETLKIKRCERTAAAALILSELPARPPHGFAAMGLDRAAIKCLSFSMFLSSVNNGEILDGYLALRAGLPGVVRTVKEVSKAGAPPYEFNPIAAAILCGVSTVGSARLKPEEFFTAVDTLKYHIDHFESVKTSADLAYAPAAYLIGEMIKKQEMLSLYVLLVDRRQSIPSNRRTQARELGILG